MCWHEGNQAADAREPIQEAEPSVLPDSGRLIVESAQFSDSESGQQAVDPVIARFRAALKKVQTSELERLYRRLPELDECSRQVIWQFADCLVANMIQPPLECLSDESFDAPPHRLLDALQRLYRLTD